MLLARKRSIRDPDDNSTMMCPESPFPTDFSGALLSQSLVQPTILHFPWLLTLDTNPYAPKSLSPLAGQPADGGVVQIQEKVDDIYTTDCWGRKKVTAKASDVLKRAGKLEGDAGLCCI